MSISSDEVNFLVYRYLQESGFHHAAFTFGYESFANRSTIPSSSVPPGALVSFVQKGLQYFELEANLTVEPSEAPNEVGNGGAATPGEAAYVMDGGFNALTPSELITKDITQLRAVVNKRRDDKEAAPVAPSAAPAKNGNSAKKGSNQQAAKRERDGSEKQAGAGKGEGSKKTKGESSQQNGKMKKDGASGKQKDTSSTEAQKTKEVKTKQPVKEAAATKGASDANATAAAEGKGDAAPKKEAARDANVAAGAAQESEAAADARHETIKDDDADMMDVDGVKVLGEKNGTTVKPAPIVVPASAYDPINSPCIPDTDVRVLKGHTNEVFFCAWNPKFPLLASGSGDQTARIWKIPEGPLSTSPADDQKEIVCTHKTDADADTKHEVTTLDWNSSGTLLATGSYDGKASVWNCDGELQYKLEHHEGPIFSMKWNHAGTLILSGSLDKTAIVWDAGTGKLVKQFRFHDAPMLDVDWRNDSEFATCSTDRVICVCQVDSSTPLRRFYGHDNEVNAIEWDPTGRMLASCSDDRTAKIWTMDSEEPVCRLTHDKEIYTCQWRRSLEGEASQSPMLATASFDATVKLWDVERKSEIHTLRGHSEPVYTIAFNHTGEYLLSGSFDKLLHVWSVKDGSLVRTYRSSGGIFEACWSNDGRQIAACHADNSVSVIDFRM